MGIQYHMEDYTRFTPYELVYGKKAMFPIEFEFSTLRTTSELNMDLSSAQQERLQQLNALDEYRMQALFHTEVVQLQRKIWHDKALSLEISKKETGHSYMTPDSKTSREIDDKMAGTIHH
jgi:hypothetical protein